MHIYAQGHCGAPVKDFTDFKARRKWERWERWRRWRLRGGSCQAMSLLLNRPSIPPHPVGRDHRPPKTSRETGAGLDVGPPSLLAHHIFRVGDTLRSSAFSPPGPCLRPPRPKAAAGGECLVPAVLSSGNGACGWVSRKDKILSLNEGQDTALQNEATEKGWTQRRE